MSDSHATPSQQISRRHFLGLAVKTSAVGLGAFLLSKIPARAADAWGSRNSDVNSRGTWKIELLPGYPYPPSLARYAQKARFSSPDQAMEKFYSRQWPVKIVNTL